MSCVRLPLGALRAVLDGSAARADWLINPDGLCGRGLVQPAGAPVTYPLTCGAAPTLRATACLFPHDWRDGVGSLRAAISVVYADGARERVWWSDLATASALGPPGGVPVALTLPSATTALVLEFSQVTGVEGPAVARGVWLEPSLTLPATSDEAPAVARTATSASVDRPAADERPLISVLTPVHDPPLPMLRECVESVRTQTFGDWQLCLVDDGSRDPVIREALRHYAEDPRIVLTRHDQAGGIAAATNSAIALADGEYVALLDHDDYLEPVALERVAALLANDPSLDMVYTDEDIVLDGRAVWTHIKPGWSLDTLRTNGYTCHLGVYRRSLVREIGGFRDEFNGSQDVDMILRLVERTDRIGHVPEVLYHWRMHVDSTAGGDAKPYAYVAARRAIAEHLERSGIPAEVGYGPPGLYRVVHRPDPAIRAAIVLAVPDARGLTAAARSWVAQPHRSWDVVVATPADARDAVRSALAEAGVEESRLRVVDVEPGQAPGASLAAATAAADAQQLLLLERPMTGLTHDWLTRLIGYSAQPGIAAAGPVVLAATGRIQDAGVAIPGGLPLPLLQGRSSSMDEFFGYGTSTYNVIAVSGALATSRTVLERVGGPRDPDAGLALVDYCLRAHTEGLRTVVVADARLQATGPDRTRNDLPALARFRATWLHRHDPYYNSQWRSDHGDFAVVPR